MILEVVLVFSMLVCAVVTIGREVETRRDIQDMQAQMRELRRLVKGGRWTE